MTNSKCESASLLAGLCLLPLASFAHHAAQVTYHTDQIIEVEGEITSLVWRNPHIRFTMNVPDAQGRTVLWNVESIPVTRLTRVGVSADLISVGQTVTVTGFPSRRSTTDVYAINLLLPMAGRFCWIPRSPDGRMTRSVRAKIRRRVQQAQTHL
jgi:hypothetical protein